MDNITTTESYRVDTGKGTSDGRLSSQWYNRPDDERFLSLEDLYAATYARADNSSAYVVQSKEIKVQANTNSPTDLHLELPDGRGIVEPTNWSFQQACSLVGAPAKYLQRLPATLAAINLQHGLMTHRAELVKAYSTTDGRSELRALTGPDYGRIYDWEIVQAMQSLVERSGGYWKVPGVLDWMNGKHNPHVDVTKQTTTLYASDRDVFVFLCDDTRPIEIGKLPNGDPDLVFKGVMAWNSEVGKTVAGLAMFLLRGVCANRILWGVEESREIRIRHSKYAPDRFAAEVAPALAHYATAGTEGVLTGINNAREAIVARQDEDRETFLRRRGFTQNQAKEVIDTVLREEGHMPSSVWDFVQGITAVARTKGHQDARVQLERTAGNLMAKAAA